MLLKIHKTKEKPRGIFFLNFQYNLYALVVDCWPGKIFTPIKIIYICKVYRLSFDNEDEDKKMLIEEMLLRDQLVLTPKIFKFWYWFWY